MNEDEPSSKKRKVDENDEFSEACVHVMLVDTVDCP